MCKKLIFKLFFVLLAMLILPDKVFGGDPNSDIPVYGTVDGNYMDTWVLDGILESITEVSDGNTSYLEHKWTIDVNAGDAVILYLYYPMIILP